MITAAPLFTLSFIFYCLPLTLSWKLTPLTIDEHPCKPEKLKFQNRYICDSEGNVECLTGWQNRSYNVDKHFPCSEPICNPSCINGECKLPNVCSCDIGWDGLDCGTCIDMPGCVNGGCVNPVTMKSEPFKCICKEGWKGALCDLPDCADHCNHRGECVVAAGVTTDAGKDRQCNCNLGWTGDTCEQCEASVGCNKDHTETALGCQIPASKSISLDIEDVPNSCQCTDHWTGPFCELPKCLNSTMDGEIQCVHGVCTAGGTDASDNVIAAFCKCNVGWKGEKCDECTPHPMCPNTNAGDIAACIHPYDCRCEGEESDKTDANNFKFCTEFIPTGSCANDADCPTDGEVCDSAFATCLST